MFSIFFRIVYRDVGYYSIDFIRVIIYCNVSLIGGKILLTVDNDYRIGIVEVENNKLC